MRSFLGWKNLKMCLKHAAHIPKMNMLRQNNFMILSNSFWTSLLTIHFVQKIRIRIRNGKMVYYKQSSQHGLEVTIIHSWILRLRSPWLPLPYYLLVLQLNFEYYCSGRSEGSVRNIKQIVDNHGHSFTKKNFTGPRPIYCQHCLDMLNWSLFNNGLTCEGTNVNVLLARN